MIKYEYALTEKETFEFKEYLAEPQHVKDKSAVEIVMSYMNEKGKEYKTLETTKLLLCLAASHLIENRKKN